MFLDKKMNMFTFLVKVCMLHWVFTKFPPILDNRSDEMIVPIFVGKVILRLETSASHVPTIVMDQC